jgi:hypothetical protein
MYMAEALDMVCRKRKLDNPKEWGLMLSDPKIPIPLDRTVASLAGKTELLLVKRSDYPMLGKNGVGRTTDPNASILKRMSEVPEGGLDVQNFAISYKVGKEWITIEPIAHFPFFRNSMSLANFLCLVIMTGHLLLTGIISMYVSLSPLLHEDPERFPVDHARRQQRRFPRIN